MAHGEGPFDIVPVKIAEQFLKVGQVKANALNFDIAQENLRASRQERVTSARTNQLFSDAFHGNNEAFFELVGLDRKAAKELLDINAAIAEGEVKVEEREFKANQERLRKQAAFAAELKDLGPESFELNQEQNIVRAIELGIDPEVAQNVTFDQLDGFIIQAQETDDLLRFVTPQSPTLQNMIKINPDGSREVRTFAKGSPEIQKARDEGFLLAGSVTVNFDKPPSGFRSADGNLEAIPGGPGAISVQNLETSISRNVASITAPLFGGVVNPLTGMVEFPSDAEEGKVLRSVRVQARAIELLESGEANSAQAAVLKAFEEIEGKKTTDEIPQEPERPGFLDKIVDFFTPDSEATIPDDQAQTLITQAKVAIENGKDVIAVLKKLKETGVSIQQAKKSDLREFLEARGITVKQLRDAGII